MTLSELVSVLDLEEQVSVPSTLEDLNVVNEEDVCRYTQLNYFQSESFNKDTTDILNELVTVLNTTMLSLKDFALRFDNSNNKNLHLILTHNTY